MSGPAPRSRGEYPAEEVGKVIDEFLDKARGGKRRRRPSADELIGWLGDALDRWPDDWEPGERDEVSHVIARLEAIAERERQAPRGGRKRG
jgi:hypothetical protein